ncbi:hypothetical protein [Echinicola salinicaeni]|uniref:hypothetical protein n=1 Tax=Echinicola salinicaeni TaxID=2762757 RepID=UPI001646C936|nr:hypothetical protein [Echinicola salinicaeni]
MNLKGGVLIIGSLFWQDYRDNKNDSKDKKRKEWRDKHLDMTSAKDVVVPIRYGRFSSKDGGTYTMVFDPALNRDQYGVAKVVGFKRAITSLDDLTAEAKELSKAEGKGTKLIKGIQDGNDAWCVCTILFHPKHKGEEIAQLKKKWLDKVKSTEDKHDKIKGIFEAPEAYMLTATGELEIPWPEGLDDLDFLLATSTKSGDENGINRIITPKKIAKYIPNRDYVIPNIKHGIRTFQDEEVLGAYIATLSDGEEKEILRGLIAE